MSGITRGGRRTPIGRRSFLRRGAALGVGSAAWLLAACGGGSGGDGSGGSSSASSSGPGTPRTGGTVTVAHPTLQPFATQDPLFNSFLGTYVMIQNLREAPLVELNDKLQPAPGTAASWEVSPDGTEYVFKLRPGVTFHDGTPVDGEAVKWNIERHNPKNTKYPPGVTVPVVLPARVEAVDATTVKAVLEKPYPAFLQDMTAIELGPLISMKAHARLPADPYGYEGGADSKPVTPGAFKVDRFVAKESISLTRNDAYYGGAPHLDRVEFRAVAEDGTRVTLLKTGEAMVAPNVPPQEVESLQSDPDFVVDSRPGQKVLQLKMNMLKEPFGPGEDERAIKFRQALLYAIDREAIIKTLLKGQGSVADSGLIPSQFGYASTKKYPYDPNRAKQLLAEARWDSSYQPIVTVGEGFATAAKEVAETIQAMMRQVGMNAKLDVWGDFGALVRLTYSRDPNEVRKWDINFSSWSMLPEPSSRIAQILRSKNGLTNFDSPSMDALLEKQLYATNDADRKKHLAEVQQVIMDKLPYVPLYYQYFTIAWKKNLKGIAVQDTESFDLRKAWIG
jgi:peptide/nickel transport system substrate-binding protein